jgi:methionyl-tRNA formyltransferase
MLKKEDGRIDWSLTAAQIYNRMRAFTFWPGAYTALRGQTWQVWGRPTTDALAASTEAPGTIESSSSAIYVVCGHGTILELVSAQGEGRKRVAARDFVNGLRLTPGERFGA